MNMLINLYMIYDRRNLKYTIDKTNRMCFNLNIIELKYKSSSKCFTKM